MKGKVQQSKPSANHTSRWLHLLTQEIKVESLLVGKCSKVQFSQPDEPTEESKSPH